MNILCEIHENHNESNHVPRKYPTVVAFKMGLTLVLTARKLYIPGLAVQVYLRTIFWGDCSWPIFGIVPYTQTAPLSLILISAH